MILFPYDHGEFIVAKAGYPGHCCPIGYTNIGEPIGITFAGTAFSEPNLIECAYSFEQGTKSRRPPVL